MYHVYGKPGCGKCAMFKNKMKQTDQKFTYYTIGEDVTFDWIKEQIAGTDIKQLPVVFLENGPDSKVLLSEKEVSSMLK